MPTDRVAKDEDGTLGFFYDGMHVGLPYWFLAFVPATIATIPWFRWSKRFSLRTLLIATTLIAVVLGIIVWLSR